MTRPAIVMFSAMWVSNTGGAYAVVAVEERVPAGSRVA